MRGKAKLAIFGASVAALGATTPALAATSSKGFSVSFLASAPSGTRTLLVQDTQGNDLTAAGAALDVSSGSNSFVTKVIDSSTGYANTGYAVQAMMSNLYPYNGTAYTSCSQMIHSGQLSLSSPNGLINVSGVSALLTPVFSLSGNLTLLISGAGITLPLGINPNISNLSVSGIGQSLSQAQIAGAGNTGNLFGSVLSGVANQLPISVLGNPTALPFTSPAQDPSGSNCSNVTNSSTATQVPVMTGTANASPLITELTSVINTATASTTPSAAQLISQGYLDPNVFLQAVSTALGVPVTDITGNLVNPNLASQIESTLTETLGNPLSLASGLTGQSGTYSAQPNATINTSGIARGGWRGTMTISLISN